MLHLGRSLMDGVGLAPMEGVSDFPLRLWMSVTSQPLFQVTPFLRVTSTYPKNIPVHWAPELLLKGLGDKLSYSLVPQLMCPEPGPFVETAKRLLDQASFVELNCGCPAPVVVGKGAGSGLLREPAAFHNFISTCLAELGDEKLAVKIRTGFESSERYEELIGALKGLPLKRLTIHGRTRAQKYQGYANWEQIQYAARELGIPVHGSGDITDCGQFHARLTEQHKLAGVIIGRGSLRNPWIFEELRTGIKTRIEAKAIVAAVECYALILEAFSANQEELYGLCLEGTFTQKIHADYEAWQQLRHQLKAILPRHQNSLISKKSLGKVKMLWNYFRSSLPLSLFNPKILRCTRYEDFLTAIKVHLEALDQVDPRVSLSWQQNYDWIYAGEKRPKPKSDCR
ncbi:MAG: tRNA-dihydrouridine synthase family protein [Oligoflexales bacterium]|nr:tRNA-dihydrouridine synthase family protein [Oligoflexales bacterium]